MAALIKPAVAIRSFPGERVSGDAAVVKAFPGGVLLAVVDGLGHGYLAAHASNIAVETLSQYRDEEPTELMRRCHLALQSSRGAALSLASIDGHQHRMAWVGVGNVDGLLIRFSGEPPKHERLLTRSGVVGYQLPPLRKMVLPLNVDDLLIFTSDGIASDFTKLYSAIDPLLKHQPVQEIADRILRMFGKKTDDALVLVARYIGDCDE